MYRSRWLDPFAKRGMRTAQLSIVAAVVILGCASPVQADGQRESANDKTYAAQGDSTAKPPPVTQTPQVRPITQPQPKKLQGQAAPPAPKEEGPFGLNAEWWTAIFTGVLTVATAALWAETRRTINHARRASEHELRPYVFVHNTQFERKPAKLENIRDKGPKVTTGRISFDYRNTGKTPANHVQVGVKARLIEAGEIIDFTDVG